MAATLSNPQVGSAIVVAAASTGGSYSTTTNVNHATANTYTVGSSSGNVNKVYDATFSVTSGVPLSLDLNSGLTDPQGNALVFTVVNAIKISIDNTTGGQNLTPFGGTNGLLATSTVLLYAGTTPSSHLYDFGTTGITLDGTHKIITLTAASGTVTGKITVLGKG